jgi:hypothetical protein
VPEEAEVVDVPVEDQTVALAIVEVRFAAGTHEHYLVALAEGDEAVDVFERPEVATRIAAVRASARRSEVMRRSFTTEVSRLEGTAAATTSPSRQPGTMRPRSKASSPIAPSGPKVRCRRARARA